MADDLFDDIEERRFFRVRMASGAVHVGAEPPLGNGPWVPKTHDALLRWMGENGYTLVEEIPVERDYTSGHCARCGAPGVEVHHTAPREVFDDCDEWPTVDLCPAHHREWHRRMNAWAGKERPLGWEGVLVP